jgi:hypothetical protein
MYLHCSKKTQQNANESRNNCISGAERNREWCLQTCFQLVCRRHVPASDSCIFSNRLEQIEHTFFFCA